MSPPGDHRAQSAPDDRPVLCHGSALYVLDVEAGLLLGQQLVAAGHLGKARDAGAHGQALLPALDPLAELVVEHGALGARAYEAHPFCQDENAGKTSGAPC